MLCSICKKNTAVIFLKKPTAENKNNIEGICYSCAKEKGLNPLELLAKQTNLSHEEITELSSQFENMFQDISENIDIEKLNEELDINSTDEKSSGVSLGSIFSNIFNNSSENFNQNDVKKKVKIEKKNKEKKKSFLDIYGTDLTNKAKRNELDNVVGRAIEINRVIQILNRRSKNNPCLIGEPGVRKNGNCSKSCY